jgi:post-segregation antitoxin (ccd killing protein)
MTNLKRKVSVSLDEDLAEEMEAAGEPLSGQVHAAVRAELARRRRRKLLAELLDELEAVHGQVPERLIAKYERLLA